MKEIPDFNIELSQAMDYIMGSDLAQKAFNKLPFYAVYECASDIDQQCGSTGG